MFNILLVDDSATDRRLIEGLLSKHEQFEIDTAEDGLVALGKMIEKLPDVVVTDMQMPNMDGLRLVDSIRALYPRVPVILITGEGSEDLAARALQRGAAGYVPKARCAALLPDTIEHVMELIRTDTSFERIIDRATLCQFDFEIENDCSLIAPLLELAQRMCVGLGICDEANCVQIGVALEHAILNAIYHGNLEIVHQSASDEALIESRLAQSAYRDRRVLIEVRITPSEARFLVRDEGSGFNVKEVAANGRKMALTGAAGRGLFLMWAFMDTVTFDQKGSTVVMVKRRAGQPEAAPSSAVRRTVPAILGKLKPVDGTDPILLTKSRMTVGRDKDGDIAIRSASISLQHCLLYNHQGWWYVRDLKSKNGIRVNHVSFTEHLVRPGAILSIGKCDYEIDYEPHALGADGIEPPPDPF